MSRAWMLAGCGSLALAAAGCGGTGGTASSGGAGGSQKVYLAAVARAAEVTGQVPGYKFALTSSTRFGEQSFSVSGTGWMNEGGTQGQISMQVAGKALAETIDRPYVYVELPSGALDADGKPWLRADIDTFTQSFGGSSLGSSATDPTQTLSFLKAAGTVSRVGVQDVHGTPATHYHAIVQLDRYAATAPASERSSAAGYAATVKRITGSSELPLDVWIDARSRVRRIALSLHLCAPNGKIDESVDMTLYGYGRQPAVTPPPASQVTDIGDRLGTEVAHNLAQLHC